jgi:hypothetical protein
MRCSTRKAFGLFKKKVRKFPRVSKKQWEAKNRAELDKILPAPSRNTAYDANGKHPGHHTTVYIGEFNA